MQKETRPRGELLNMRRRGAWYEVTEHDVGRPIPIKANPIRKTAAKDISQPKSPENMMEFDVQSWALRGWWQWIVNTNPVLATSVFDRGVGEQYTPQGGVEYDLNRYHTNLEGSRGRMDHPQRFRAVGMAHYIDQRVNVVDFLETENKTVVLFTISTNKIPYADCLLPEIPFGTGATGITSVDVPAMGWPVSSNFYGLTSDEVGDDGKPDKGVRIAQGANFKVTLDPTQDVSGGALATLAGGETGGRGVRGWVFLLGVLWREGKTPSASW